MPNAPFPRIPDSLREKYCAAGMYLRGFGIELEDLTPDFGSANRSRLERDVLACCVRMVSGESLPAAFFRDLEVGKRTEVIVQLAELTTGRAIDAELRCANSECGNAMEVELTAREMSELQRAAEDSGPPALPIGSDRLPLRRPTGADEDAWRRQRLENSEAAQDAMAESLVPDEYRLHFRRAATRNDGWADLANGAMEEADPLVHFRVRLNCPFCAVQDSYRVDLAEIALRRLRSAQQGLIVGIHRLASRYHWSEREIFEVPAWRRRMYLTLLDREVRS
jgi:hypothetical protein